MQVCRMRKRAEKCVDCCRKGAAGLRQLYILFFDPGRQRHRLKAQLQDRWWSLVVLSFSATFSEIHFSFDIWQFLPFFAQLQRQAFVCRNPYRTESQLAGADAPKLRAFCEFGGFGSCRIARWEWSSRNHFRSRLASEFQSYGSHQTEAFSQ